MAEYGSGLVRINSSWDNLKTIVVTKNLSMQYDESSTAYDIFAIDGSIVYYILIFKGVVPDSSFNQVQNDADKADFETNYKNLVTNRPTTPSATYDGYAVTTANPTLIAASDGSFVKTVRADTSGRLITVGLGTAGSPAGGLITIQGDPAGTPIPISGSITTPTANDIIATGTIAANGASVTTTSLNSISSAAIQITGTWVGTITFEASLDNTVFNVINVRATNTGTISTTTTANNIFRVSLAGYQFFRLRSTAWTSGTATITIRSSIGNNNLITESLPTGSNTIGAVTISGTATVTSADTNATGTLNALNAAATVATADKTSVGFRLTAGTLIGTIVPEISLDGGTTWSSTFFDDPGAGSKESSITFATNNGTIQRTIVLSGGVSNVRVRVSAFTSGTAAANIRATKTNDPTLLFTGSAGGILPPTVGQMGGSDGTNLRTIRVASDGTVRIDPTGTTIQPVSGTVTSNQGTPAAATSPWATRLSDGTSFIDPRIIRDLTNSDVVTAEQGGTWNINNISGSISLPTGAATESSLVKLTLSQGSSTSGQTGALILGAVTTAAPTYTNAQSSPLSLDTTGALRVNVTAGGGANPSVSATGASPPASATYIAGSVTTAAPTYTTGQMNPLSLTTAGALRIDGSGVTQPISGTVTVGNLIVVTGQSTDNSANSTAKLAVIPAVATTAAPSYSSGNMVPLSLTTGGLLRVDGSSVTQPVSGTVAATQSGAWNITNITGTISLPTGAATESTLAAMSAKLPAALVGGRLDINNGAWLGSTAPTVGQKTMANSLPIAIASDQSSLTVAQTTATNLNAQVHQGTANIANAWYQRITDGTNTAAVKASSTAAIATDPALVVAVSPNNLVTVNTPDVVSTGNLTALNTTVTINPNGAYTCGGQILGTWVGTITAEGTIDGVNWFTVRTANKSTNDIIQTYTANDAFEFYSVAGCVSLRLRMSAYTSGTANIVLTCTSLATDAFLNYSGTTNDTGPPQRHVSIGTLTNDGTSFHALYNANSAPVGDEYALITRSIGYGDQQSSFSPDPTSHTTGSTGETFVDDSNNLQVRGQVLTDEGSFRDDFTGSSLTTALSGTPSWTNGSTTVTGTSFQTTVKSGDYIKKTADANTLYVRVLSVDSDTSLTLETAYAGTTAAAASVKSNWIPTIGASGTIAVGTSNLTITTGTTNGVINNIIRRGDYGPVTMRIYASVSQRIANQELRLGFSDNVASLTPNIAAYVSFTGTNNTVCNFVTSSSTAAADTQTTAVTLPSGNTAALHEYKIDIGHSQATLSIDGTVVARNTIHIPGPYDSLDLMCLAANTGTAGSSTTLTVDYAYFMNANRVQIDDDFNGEALYVQGNGFAGSPPTSGVLGVMAPDNAFSGAFSGLNSTWVVTLTGSKGMGFTLAAGTLIGTIVAEISFDGSNWFPTSMNDPVNNISSSSLVFTSANGAVVRSIETVAGAFQARVRISAYTSGTANITIRATQLENTLKTITSTDGNRTTYSASFNGLVAASSPTDIWTISGSSSRTIRISRITVTATQSTSAQRDILLIKRSSANTGGTSTTATIASHDSNNIAPTAVIRGYTANPSGLGTSAGVLRTRKVFIGAGTSNSDEFLIEFGTRNDQALVLRGTAEFACINLNGVTSASNSFNISVTWTEE